MKKEEITLMATQIKAFCEKNYKTPGSVKVKGKAYNRNQCLYILGKSVHKIGRDVDLVVFGSAPTPYKGSFNKTLSKSEYISIAKNLCSFIEKKKRVPNFAYYKDDQVNMDVCLYSFAKIVDYHTTHKAMPSTCKFTFPKKKSTVKIGKLTKAIQNKTGVTITDYKSLYRAFYEAVYDYYYDDQKSQSKALANLKNGLNCVDLNQLAYYSLKEMGYNVKIVRGTVECETGTYGHVWCRLKIDGEWINFDASASAKGKGLGSVICGSVSSVTDIDPQWLLSDDGVT